MSENKNIFFFLLFLAMIGWGGSWVNAKVLSDYVGPFELVFIRYALTAFSMIPILLYLKKSWKIDLKTFVLILMASILLIAYTKYFFLGTKLGTASLGGAFVTTLIPIITFLILVIFFKRPVFPKDVFALGIGAIGVMTILGVWHLDASKIFTTYNLYFVFAALLWPLLTIVSSKSTKISPLVFTFYMYVCSTLFSAFLIDIPSINTTHWDGLFWTHMLFLAFGATTFSTTIYFLGIEKLGAKEVSSFIFLVPFAAIGLSILILDEPFNLWMVLGTAMTIIAVALLNNLIKIKKRKEKTTQS